MKRKIQKMATPGKNTVDGRMPAAGDYYGTGFKQPTGRMRGQSVGYIPVSRKQLSTPPKSVV